MKIASVWSRYRTRFSLFRPFFLQLSFFPSFLSSLFPWYFLNMFFFLALYVTFPFYVLTHSSFSSLGFLFFFLPFWLVSLSSFPRYFFSPHSTLLTTLNPVIRHTVADLLITSTVISSITPPALCVCVCVCVRMDVRTCGRSQLLL